MTLSELKRKNEQSGGVFFNRRTMHFWGDTMKGFSIRKNGLVGVIVTRKRDGTEWRFNAETGRQTDSGLPKPSEESHLNELGDKLAAMLNIPLYGSERDSEGRLRWDIQGGNKTGLGLLRTIERFLSEAKAIPF